MPTVTHWEELADEVTRAQAEARVQGAMPHWDPLRVMASLDRRSEKRIPLVFPIRLQGLAPGEGYFSELTFTLDVSENGCRFATRTRLFRGCVVAISVAPRDGSDAPSEKALYEVAWTSRRDNGWEVGARRLEQKNIWNVTFPEPAKEPY
jgi:hypothetical protein